MGVGLQCSRGMTTLTMEVQDVVLVVVCPRALATVGLKPKIPKVYSYTVIVWTAIPHSGQLKRSNSTLVKLTGLLNSNPIWKEDCSLPFTVKSSAAQLLWNSPRDGISPSVRSLVPPPSSCPQTRPWATTLLHPPSWSDPFTDCSPTGSVCCLTCTTGG